MKRILAFAVLPVLLSSCGLVSLFKCTPGYVRSDFAALRLQVQANKTLWTGKGVRSYEYTYRAENFSAPNPFRVTVKAGAVTGAKPIPDPQRPDASGFVPSDLQTLTMENQFANLERSLASPGDCATAKLEFDSGYGFPKSGSFTDQTNGLADGFGGFSITDFVATP
jgi:Family of unknown function (DUF6174)